MTDAKRTVVFGDDGSPGSDVAWLWLNSQSWSGWRLEIVHAHMPTLQPMPPAEEAELHPWQPDDPRVPFAEAGFGPVAHLTGDVDPRLALQREGSLLVVGPRGTGRLKALGLGSTTEYLLHDPPAPMVIARAGRPVRDVLVGADGSPHARAAIRAFAELPWAATTSVVIAAVDDGRVAPDEALDSARAIVEPIAASVRTTVLDGHVASALLAQATEDHADLVVLGTRGLTGLRPLRVGSTAGAISRAGRHNVLVAHDEAPV
jgi:nucleotide-binding universal stress UspA family protein